MFVTHVFDESTVAPQLMSLCCKLFLLTRESIGTCFANILFFNIMFRGALFSKLSVEEPCSRQTEETGWILSNQVKTSETGLVAALGDMFLYLVAWWPLFF